MKILHIITRLIVGGAMENTILSCEGAVASGHDVILASGPTYGPEGSMLDRVHSGAYEFYELQHMHRQISPLRDYAGLKEVNKLIKTLQPDIVHTHASKAGLLGRRAAFNQKVPGIVHTIHGLAFHPYQSSLKNNIYINAEKRAARWCHKMVTVCDAMRDQSLAVGIGKPSQYQTVYSGMDVDRFANSPVDPTAIRESLSIKPDDFVLGTVARLFELKGHDDLLDAYTPLFDAYPNFKLMWVGDGLWRERLAKRIEEMGIKDRVILTGLVPPTRVPAMMRAMNALVHPSYREGLARALPQALLSGIPVISYDCDGAPEVCIENQTGKLVKTGDKQALYRATQYLLDHPEKCRQMADTGKSMCLERFSARNMCDDLHQIYEQIQT